MKTTLKIIGYNVDTQKFDIIAENAAAPAKLQLNDGSFEKFISAVEKHNKQY